MSWRLNPVHRHGKRARWNEYVVQSSLTMPDGNGILSGGLALTYLFKIYGLQTTKNNFLAENESIDELGFHRDHAALHYACFREEVPEIARAFRKKGYGLVERPMSIGLGLMKADNHLHLNPQEFKKREYAELHGRNNRLAKVDENGKILSFGTDITAYIDLYIHEKQITPFFKQVYSYDDSMTLPLKWFQPLNYKLPETGKILQVANPAYLYAIKVRHARRYQEKHRKAPEKDITDIGILERILRYVGEKPSDILEYLKFPVQPTEMGK